MPPRSGAEMTVLDVTEWYGDTSGGIRTYLHAKSAYVAASPRYRHVLAVPGATDAVDETHVRVRRYQLRGPRIPMQQTYRFMLATRSLRRIVEQEQPSVIEVGSPFLVPWLIHRAVRARPVPLVGFYHTDVVNLFGGRRHGLIGPHTTRAALRTYLQRLDRLFAVTVVASASAHRALVSQGIDRVVHIPLGVDLQSFSPERRADAAATRARLGLPEGPLVGFVGRFAPEKHLEVVIDGWAEVTRRTGATLVLMGAGPLEPRLRRRAAHTRVLIVPFESERRSVAEFMASLDVLVAPGPAETFCLAAAEALACGTPLLAPNAGAAGEHVRASGAGRTYRVDDVHDFVASAVALLHDDLHRLGRIGRVHAETNHDWQRMFDRLFATYREIGA